MFVLETRRKRDGRRGETAEGLREKRCAQMQLVALTARRETRQGCGCSVRSHPGPPACTAVVSIYASLFTRPNRIDRFPVRSRPHGQPAHVDVWREVIPSASPPGREGLTLGSGVIPTSEMLTRPSWKEQSLAFWVHTWRYLHQWQGKEPFTQERQLKQRRVA